MIHTPSHHKNERLLEELEARKGSVLVFVKTKYATERLAKSLKTQGHKADAIHGDLRQNLRTKILQNFRDKKYRILVATDIAARGLDIDHIEHVINFDLPQAPEDYIHRIGRTARAGAEGSSLCMISPEDASKWKAIQNLLNPGSTPESHQKQHKKRSYGRPTGGGGKNFAKPSSSKAPYTGSKEQSWKGKKPGSKPHGAAAGGAKPFYSGKKKVGGPRNHKSGSKSAA